MFSSYYDLWTPVYLFNQHRKQKAMLINPGVIKFNKVSNDAVQSHDLWNESVLRQGEWLLWLVLYCVQVFIIILEEFTTSAIKLIHWNLPLGHLDSRDSSIQGMQKLVLDRCSVNLCMYLLNTSIEGTPLFRGKVHFFWIPKPKFKLHSGDIQHPKINWQQKGITW